MSGGFETLANQLLRVREPVMNFHESTNREWRESRSRSNVVDAHIVTAHCHATICLKADCIKEM